ncbi:hypothetical protein [Yinghuangia soli]|uniref:Uncharacterized protein n=1 Tax=Yinghuangia soli TaxID=2908204 RepID=A0AA41U3I6_9ACTN|nr:hypothetical protein [Yinghuangia soli]MCF2529757.1 hypothetical protein [Yinghuangia soli]
MPKPRSQPPTPYSMPRRRPRPRTVLAAVLPGLVLLVSACTGSDAGPPDQVAQRPSKFTPTAPVTGIGNDTLDCTAAIETITALPDNYANLLDVVGVIAPDTPLTLSPEAARDQGRTFVKTGLVVRAGRAFELGVPSDAAERPAIQWGSRREAASVVTVPACPAREDAGTWMAFVGGFYVEHPMCVPLTVRTPDGKQQTHHIPIGKPCP